jgi:mRNA interferase MazF
VTPRRGDIWLVDFGEPVGAEQAGRRPAVIISADRLNESRAGITIVIPCTTRRRGLPSHVEIDADASGLDAITCAKCDDIKSISDERLISRLGAAAPAEMFRMTQAVGFLIGL